MKGNTGTIITVIYSRLLEVPLVWVLQRKLGVLELVHIHSRVTLSFRAFAVGA